ncbi:C2 calcium/lipid-binding plant phosphoribosyltransferase family protein [Rhynchospora pubera]|uniref:C2 calcium/lipid-binding plant phosphoribosyltransferase family protein n=1 Tax=Rhynchospora pubera TaxID=906938 RepID=A0AAV8E597_9POAL|nr:C2 calcium/lipid-binding plant phosphoribosyltransferase family protein [Rhynchospora pubera]
MAKGENLVVEVVGAHNLMPKDGQGSSSPYVEVEFEHQKRRTRSKPKDLNPVWNERLVFPVSDPDDLPYRSIDVAIYNDRSLAASSTVAGGGAAVSSGRKFLGKVRIPASGIPAPGEESVPQLFTLEKRGLFSHIRGEISLKMYRVYADMESHAGPTTERSLVTKVKGHNGHEKKLAAKGDGALMVPPQPVKKRQPESQIIIPPVQHTGPVSGGTKPVVLVPGGTLGQPDFYHMPGMYPGMMNVQDFSIKETHPRLGGAATEPGDKTSATYDLVEQMQYLYVRVVRARDLYSGGTIGGETHAEVKLGNYRGVTRPHSSHYWDQVFAFSRDSIQSSVVEIFVKERDRSDDFIGRIMFDLSEVPRRVPPDSTLAPQWYRLEDKKGDKSRTGELMVSVWFGTQADEAFAEAWHSKAAGVHGDGLGSIKSKVYVAPKLWYLRVTILEAQDLMPVDKNTAMMNRYPEIFAKAQVGNQLLRTRVAPVIANRGPSNPVWKEDLLFVVAEPFDDVLMVSIEDRVGPGRDDLLGRFVVPVSAIERRWNDKQVQSRWFPLDRGQNAPGVTRFGSRVHLRLSLDGGYHVLDESTMYSSDLRATAKQLWAPHVGVLELGILGASGLMPMKVRDGKGGGATDAYCVAKYGQKWIRTRTVVESLNPRWNEQYTWEVYDPCTVITIGVFDNCHVEKNQATNGSGSGRDSRVGKVRVRLSTLESDRVYTHSYPLLMLHPSGVKKMGELHLAVRFSCANMGNMLHAYVRPLLPKLHYVEPLLVRQVEHLRYQATNVVAARLGRAEPPLGREVVEFMLDHGSHLWSMRRSKANFFRLVNTLSATIDLGRRFEVVRSWNRPVLSVMVVLVFLVFVLVPEIILPTLFLIMGLVGMLNYRARPRQPPHMDMRLSHADVAYPDELDEEFDTFPTARSAELVRMRYDRLRSVAGRVQTVVGDVATQAERFEALLSWRDPRATLLFLGFCVLAAVAIYCVPMKLVIGLSGLYLLLPPRFRSRMPSPVMNFFRRLPTKADSLL